MLVKLIDRLPVIIAAGVLAWFLVIARWMP
jgi:hypothetical protein